MSGDNFGCVTLPLTPNPCLLIPLMQRHILAALAILLLVGAVVLQIWWPGAEVALACCWRGGAILAAAWLAYDDVQRLPNWLIVLLPVLLVVLIRWPRLLLVMLPFLAIWVVIQRAALPRIGPAAAVISNHPSFLFSPSPAVHFSSFS